MDFYTKTAEQALKELSTTADGLSEHEARLRLKKHGLNELTVKGEPLWKKLVEPFVNVFTLVLGAAVIISLWHHAYLDAAVIGIIIAVSAAIYYIQRFSTEKILRTLSKSDAQKVSVLRFGKVKTALASQLVPGDIVYIGEGDKVPADIRLTSVQNLHANESMLTGESNPIAKSTTVLKGQREVYERANSLFQGSFITTGHGIGVVTHTGNATEFGKIAALSTKEQGSLTSPVQRKIDILIGWCMAVIGAVSVVAFLLAVVRGMPVSEALQFVIALAVSAVPEGLPIAISVILVLGMRRMAKKKALVRTMRSIETIGVITTIATDKTGTLTKNVLSVQEVWVPSWVKQGAVGIHQLSLFTNHAELLNSDPLDKALSEYARKGTATPKEYALAQSLPFEHTLAMSGNVWKHKKDYTVTLKGAPEAIIKRSSLSKQEKSEIEYTVQAFASNGYRVIACAASSLRTPAESLAALPKSLSFDFCGLIAIADTLRPSAKRAIATAQRAGVTVRMITGDHFQTAYSIGRQLGLVQSEAEVFDATTIQALSKKQFKDAVQAARVFSRVTPENKYKILQVLKATEVTAMTGDGVNDVPALSSAHVGVAMGSGSQIAKDAGDILLLNDNFASIVHAMKEGRIIFANIKRMLFYLLSTNIGEVIVAVGALIMGIPLPLAPIQILWINLVTDTTMVIPLGLEPGEKDVLKRKPASPTAPLLSRYMIARIILVAGMMAAVTLGLYMYFSSAMSVAYGQTIAFLALVVMQWANALNARSTYGSVLSRITVKHHVFWIGLGISILLQLIVFIGPLQTLLHVHPITLTDGALASGIAVLAAIIPVEIHKAWGRRKRNEA